MSYDVYKAAVLRVLPEAAEIPLEAPPTEAFDLQDNQTCPACGGSDATVQVVEDTEVARCPHCQCEFPPRLESVSRRVIRGISERRERRHARFMERLAPQAPLGLDQTDYDLFRKIVNKIDRDAEDYDRDLDSSVRYARAHERRVAQLPAGTREQYMRGEIPDPFVESAKV